MCIRKNQSVVAGVDMPISSYVVDATPERPFLSLYVHLDWQILSSLAMEMEQHSSSEPAPISSISIADADAEILEMFSPLILRHRPTSAITPALQQGQRYPSQPPAKKTPPRWNRRFSSGRQKRHAVTRFVGFAHSSSLYGLRYHPSYQGNRTDRNTSDISLPVADFSLSAIISCTTPPFPANYCPILNFPLSPALAGTLRNHIAMECMICAGTTIEQVTILANFCLSLAAHPKTRRLIGVARQETVSRLLLYATGGRLPARSLPPVYMCTNEPCVRTPQRCHSTCSKSRLPLLSRFTSTCHPSRISPLMTLRASSVSRLCWIQRLRGRAP